MGQIETRSEILFVYEVKDANPNGDPRDDNKPRLDPDTGQCLVSDVRIKRTIRDYWYEAKGLEILIRDTYGEQGFLREGNERASDFEEGIDLEELGNVSAFGKALQEKILEHCIDSRVFGCTLPIRYKRKGERDKEGSITLTGPVQFAGFGRSLHPVSVQFIQGTAAFAGGQEKSRKSFREEYKVPYACIASYAVVNEIAAKKTGMTSADRTRLLEALWNGTSGLITRSKMGHQPLLLLHIQYRSGYRLGDLAGRLRLQTDEAIEGRAIRSVDEYKLELDELLGPLEEAYAVGKVESVEYCMDSRLQLTYMGEAVKPFGQIEATQLEWD